MRGRRILSGILPSAIFIFALILGIKYWDMVVGKIGLFVRVASPLLMGLAIAYILNITMSFYEKRFLNKLSGQIPLLGKFKRMVSIILALLSFVLIIALILVMVIPQMQTAVNTIINKMPEFTQKIANVIQDFERTEFYQFIGQFLQDNPLNAGITSADVTEMVKNVLGWLQKDGISGTMGILNSAIGTTLNIFMGFIFAFYLLAGKENLLRQLGLLVNRFVEPQISRRLSHVVKILDESFHSFIVGQVLEAMILGTLCAIGMMILRFPYAVMIGVVVGATAIIPIFGAYIGAAVGFIMIFTESPVQALLFVVYINVLQQLENQLIYPKVVGSSIGLPGIWIFVSVVVGSGLFGVTGMLFFIPLVATAYRLLREKVHENIQHGEGI